MADQTITTSKFLSLNASDFIKALIMAVGGAVADYLYTALTVAGASFSTIHWADIGKTALLAAIVYLGKNLFTPAQTVIKPAPSQPTVIPAQVPPDQPKP